VLAFTFSNDGSVEIVDELPDDPFRHALSLQVETYQGLYSDCPIGVDSHICPRNQNIVAVREFATEGCQLLKRRCPSVWRSLPHRCDAMDGMEDGPLSPAVKHQRDTDGGRPR
jgi:hypothetical protein